MKYKAEVINGKLVVKPNIERKANGDLVVHVPCIPAIAQAMREHGKRTL